MRVECITIDTQSRKERIGFALLNLRSAQIIPESKSNTPVTPAWYKLIGCQADKRKSHPELYLSLSLRDHLFNDQVDVENPNNTMPFILEEDTQNLEDTSRGAATYALKYFENGHIQIGDENIAKEPFVFNLLIKDAVNLDALLPEALVFQTNTGSYFLTFKILGIIVKTKPFQKQMHTNISLNEKIVVNLLSKRDILEKFFQTQTITISFYHGYDKLGVTKLNCDNIWDQKEEKYFFKFPSPNGIIPFGGTEQSPFITLEAWIEETPESKSPESPKSPKSLEEEISTPEEVVEKPKTRSIFSNISKKIKTPTEPDVDKINTEEPEPEVYRSPRSEMEIVPFVTKSVDTVVINDPLTPRPHNITDFYEKFVVVVSLKHLIWITPPPDTKVMFKFLHPRAGSCTTIFTEISNVVQHEISLNNLYVRIGYISTYDKINKLLKNWYPKLALANENETFISDQRALSVNCLDSKSKDYEIECKNLRTGMTLARIGINVTMRITDAKLEDDYENLYLLPIILDEIITVKEIADLMQWKKSYRAEFELKLEETKQHEIKRLEHEYQLKKDELEEKVNKTVNKCRDVQNDLRSKVAALKIERELNKMGNNEYTYDEIYKNNCKLYSRDNTQEVIEVLSRLQRDNESLKKLLAEHKEKLSQMEKATVTKVETKSLLQEWSVLEAKFSQVQTAKTYFEKNFKKAATESVDLNAEGNLGRRDDEGKNDKIDRNEKICIDIPTFYTEQIQDGDIIESASDDVSENNY